jgi:4-amino-4-deoxy-L-arabinose transferase-like glycosyltransferase
LKKFLVKTPWIFAVISTIVLGSLAHSIRLGNTLNEIHAWRQTQTAWTIREFMSGNWNISSPLPILGPPWNLPFELPLFQAFAAVIGKTLSLQPDLAARLAGLITFEISAILLTALLCRWFSRKTALIALILFQFLPFGIQWGPSSLIEFTAIGLSLGAIICADNFSRAKSPVAYVFLSTLLLSLAFMVKGTTAIAWSLVFIAAVLTPRQTPSSTWRWKLPAATLPLAVGLIAGLMWTQFADIEKAKNPIGAELGVAAIGEWYFGTLEQRLNPDNWIVILTRFPTLGFGLAGFIIILLLAGTAQRWNLRLLGLASVPFIAIGIFFNLYIFHDYYLCAVYPALVSLIAIAVVFVQNQIADSRARVGFISVATLGILAVAWATPEGAKLAETARNATDLPLISIVIQEHVPEGEAVLISGCDWDPTYLYYSERRGIMLPDWFQGEIPFDWIGREFNYIAFCGGGGGSLQQGIPEHSSTPRSGLG